MNETKLRYQFFIIIATICLMTTPHQSQAATSGKHKTAESTKERLVLMPLRVPEEDKNLTGAMETALVKGLKQKYDVFSGEQVSQKAHQIFLKESRNKDHTECDETRCMQNIAEAFQAELIAISNVTKQEGSYFLALSIQNIFDNKVVYSESLPCERCTAVQVVEKLKELSGNGSNSGESEAAMAAERKAKAEELLLEQLAFEEKLRKADDTERKRLIDAKSQDDKLLAELKAQAEVRRKSFASQSPSDFPTIESAIIEISRIKESIRNIETGYENKIAQTRKQVSQRYEAQFAAIDKIQRDEFETTEVFKAKKEQKRNELIHQRDEELLRLNTARLADVEITPLREKIKTLSEREYVASSESFAINLGAFEADAHQFPVSIRSKISNISFEMSGAIPLPTAEAKLFKQQWVAGLIRAEVKMKPIGEVIQIAIVNDADNSYLNNYGGKFMTSSDKDKKTQKIGAVVNIYKKYNYLTFSSTSNVTLSEGAIVKVVAQTKEIGAHITRYVDGTFSAIVDGDIGSIKVGDSIVVERNY